MKLTDLKQSIQYNNLSLVDMVKLMNEIEREYTRQKQTATELYEMVNFIKYSALPDKMEELGFKSVVLDGIGTLTLKDGISVKTIDKEKLIMWLKDFGFQDLITGTVNSSSLAGLVREQLEAGNDIPGDDIIKINPSTYVSLTKVPK